MTTRPTPSTPRLLEKHTYLTYDAIVTKLRDLARAYPDICSAYTAQDKYNLPTAGKCGDKPCKQWVFVVGNKAKHVASTPELFFSGALHGNERVGPTAVVELVEFLVSHYGKNEFVTRMVDSRLVVAMPMPNAWGYYRSMREELSSDPNRDFAFDTKPSECMRTIAGRAVNEVWRDHIFQLGATFHGGDNLIGYPWGDNTHNPGYIAGDKIAMHSLGQFMVEVAGKYGGDGLYKLGEMNDVIYPVNGGMEDWAYGGSWHKAATTCNPDSYGGYPREKTVYDSHVLRAVLYLVETAFRKTPHVSKLGHKTSVEEPFKPGQLGDGHVPRNVRLCLAALDAVEPYVEIVRNKSLSWRPEADQPKTLSADIPIVVRGVEHVDSVHVKCDDQVTCLVESSSTDSWKPWGIGRQDVVRAAIRVSYKGDVPPISTNISVGVRADEHWKKLPTSAVEKKHNAHWVLARIDPSYRVESNGKTVVGRDIWWSVPMGFRLTPKQAVTSRRSRAVQHIVVEESTSVLDRSYKGTSLFLFVAVLFLTLRVCYRSKMT
jgi:hypothetical protein